MRPYEFQSPQEIANTASAFARPDTATAALHAEAAPHLAFSHTPIIPGADLAAAGSASAQVNPLIQMMMRMPGHIGVVHSFFEFLAALFAPTHNLLSAIDLTHLGHAAHTASLLKLPGSAIGSSLRGSLSGHMPIDMRLLPSDAPIFQTMSNTLGGALGGNAIGAGGLGQGAFAFKPMTAHVTGKEITTFGKELSQDANFRSSLNVSGTLDPHKALYEAGPAKSLGETSGLEPAISGPDLNPTGSGAGSFLAGNHSVFTEKLDFASNQTNLNSGNLISSASSSHHLSSSLNVGGTAFGQSTDMLPAVGRMQDAALSGPSVGNNVGFSLSPASRAGIDMHYGPSGAVSSELGRGHLLADSTSSASSLNSGFTAPASYSGAGTAQALSPSSEIGAGSYSGLSVKPLHAKALALGDVGTGNGATDAALSKIAQQAKSASTAVQTQPSHGAMDHIAHGKHVEHSHFASQSGMDMVGHQTTGTVADHANLAKQTGMDQIGHQGSKNLAGHSANELIASSAGAKSGMDQIAHRTTSVHTPTDYAEAAHGNPGKQFAPQQVGQSGNKFQQASDNSAAVGSPAGAQANPAAGAGSGAYTVKSGDCLWNIARDHLGSGTRWQEIYKLNADTLGSNPSLIHTGASLKLPGATDIASATGDTSKYVVHAGDNLWNIAKDHLGSGEKWHDLFQANSNVIGANPRLIMPGQELSLGANPTIASAAPIGGQATNISSSSLPTAFGGPATGAPGGMQANDMVSQQFGQTQQAVPVLSSNTPETAMIGSNGAAQAVTYSSHAAAHANSAVPSSLKPDLSFLHKR